MILLLKEGQRSVEWYKWLPPSSDFSTKTAEVDVLKKWSLNLDLDINMN